MKIFFDLDGTLITAKEKQSFLMKFVASRFKIHINCDFYWLEKKSGKSNSLILEELGVERRISIQVQNNWLEEIETPFWLSLDRVFKDTHSALEEIRAIRNVNLYLLTARRKSFLARSQLKSLGLVSYFDGIYFVNPKNATKEKEHILKASKASFLIGDSEVDLAAAYESNTGFYALDTGQRSKDFLLSCGATLIYSSLSCVCSSILTEISHERL